MFEIEIEQKQYKTYTLFDRLTQSSIVVVPERGGIVISWTVQGKELFYLDQERFKDPTLSVRGGIPLLFPICGNLPGDIYELNGQTYQLKQHGFGRTSPWEVTHQTATADHASLTVTLESNAETKAVYPFDFALDYTYTLSQDRLELRQRHTNRSDAPMPFSTGIHPYFAVQDKTQLKFDLPSTDYRVKEEPDLRSFSGTFDFEQDEIDFAFTNLSRSRACVVDGLHNRRLTIDFDAHYSTLVFWTVAGKDFYCIEPWTGPRNALNTGTHLLTVAPGTTLETVITMGVDSVTG